MQGNPMDELRGKIAQHVRTANAQLAPEAVDDAADALAREHARLLGGKPLLIDPSLTELGVYYPIHNSDLKLMDEATALAAALWVLTSNPVGALGKLAVIWYRARRKRARLQGESALALLALKDAPESGWTVREVREQLGRAYGVDRPEKDVRALLRSLRDVRLSDNTRTDFADEQQGRWFAVDV